jgi:predicted acyltransferase
MIANQSTSPGINQPRAAESGKTFMTTAPPKRVLSVDVARGITIAFMILVNDPGDWNHVYGQLDHAFWNGWTLTDLVFPSFLFLIGASIIFSLQSRIAKGESRSALAGHIVRRAVILFVLGLFIAAFPHFHLTHLRLYGVLTRIALCYLSAGLICLATRKISHLAIIAATLLIGYWMLMRFVPVPGFGVPTRDIPLLDQVGNLTSWMDRGFIGFTQRFVHAGHLYRAKSDPEGLLSTLPAIATTILGAITGLIIRLPQYTQATKRNILALGAILFIIAGELWNLTFPINKNLWTSSYVLLAAGCSLLVLTITYWLVDMLRIQDKSPVARAALWPWLVFGSNAIVVYAISDFLVEILLWIKVPDNGKTITAWNWIYTHGFARSHSTEVTSLVFAIAFVLVCFIPNWLLWRKQIFVKI